MAKNVKAHLDANHCGSKDSADDTVVRDADGRSDKKQNDNDSDNDE